MAYEVIDTYTGSTLAGPFRTLSAAFAELGKRPGSFVGRNAVWDVAKECEVGNE